MNCHPNNMDNSTQQKLSRMHWLAKKLMRINQLDMPQRKILCHKCKSYLGTVAFTPGRGRHLCFECFVTYPPAKVLVANDSLVKQLEFLEYPCTSPYECHFIGSFDEATAHSKNCSPTFTCTFCNGIIDKDYTVEHFLEQHCNQKLFASHDAVFDKIAISVPLKTDKIHVLRSGYTDFILFIKTVNRDKISLTVAKCYGMSSPEFNRYSHDNFCIEWKNNHKAKSRTISIDDYFAGAAKPIGIPINRDKKERLEVKIHFNNIQAAKETTATIEECPICFEVVVFKTRKCRNGHSVCNKCQLKIVNCPFCREPMNLDMDADNMIPKRSVQCPNKHCLQVMCESRIAQHLAGNCAFEMFDCPECPTSIPRMKVLEHLQKTHKKYFQGYEFYIHSTEGSRTHYLLFKGKLFQLTIAVVGNDIATQRVNFSVKLLMEDTSLSRKFFYELHFYKQPSDVLAALTCSNFCKDTVSSSVKASAIPRVLAAKKSLGFFRIHIFSV